MKTENMERYNRQIILPEIGKTGQEKLSKARVLIVGVGGLGSPIALYLAGAGVGTIGLVDDDVVSESNLQRQVLYTEDEIGLSKALQAQKRLQALNHDIRINAYPTRLTKENAASLIANYDIVVDGCDNFTTRYIINDACATGDVLMYMVQFWLSKDRYPYSTTREALTTVPYIPMKKKCLPCLPLSKEY